MTSKQQSGQSSATDDIRRRPPFAPEHFSAICAMARKNVAPHRYLREVLEHIARIFDSPYATIHVRLSSEIVHEDCHRGPTHPNFWKDAVQDVMTDSLAENRAVARTLRARQGSTTLALLAVPIFDSSARSIGAFALVAGPVAPDDIRGLLAAIQSLLAVAGPAMDLLARPPAAPTASSEKPSPDRSKFAGPLPPHSNPREFAFAVTNGLRTRLDLEQVALGSVKRQQIQLLAISGLDEVPARSPGVAAMIAAMEECLDIGEPTTCCDPLEGTTSTPSTRYPILAQWRAASHNDNVACLPMHDGKHVVGILSLRARPGRPFTEKQLADLTHWCESMAPVLTLTTRANRHLAAHALDCASELLVRRMLGQSWCQRMVRLLLLALCLAGLMVPIPYSVSAPCRIATDDARRVSAPYAGILTSCTILSGQRVTKGQPLCTFDTRDIALQQADLDAQYKILESEENKALAAGKAIDARLAFLNRTVIRTRLDLVQRRLDSATIRAPFNGMVVAGDLRGRIGESMPMGEFLFEVAPDSSWKLELDVPEHAITQLDPGSAGTFSLNSKPEQSFPLRQTNGSGRRAVHDGKTIFQFDAEISENESWFRPGMEGIARIPAGRRPLAWQLFHRVIDPLRLRGWL